MFSLFGVFSLFVFSMFLWIVCYLFSVVCVAALWEEFCLRLVQYYLRFLSTQHSYISRPFLCPSRSQFIPRPIYTIATFPTCRFIRFLPSHHALLDLRVSVSEPDLLLLKFSAPSACLLIFLLSFLCELPALPVPVRTPPEPPTGSPGVHPLLHASAPFAPQRWINNTVPTSNIIISRASSVNIFQVAMSIPRDHVKKSGRWSTISTSPPYLLLDLLTSDQLPLIANVSLPTNDIGGRQHPPIIVMSTAVIALIIVASLSAVVGAIYLLIYFKSIKPMSARSRSYMDKGGGKVPEEETARPRSTHPLFRRAWKRQTGALVDRQGFKIGLTFG